MLVVTAGCLFLAALLVVGGEFSESLQADELKRTTPFVFHNEAEVPGILPAASGVQSTGAGWGNVDGGSWADL